VSALTESWIMDRDNDANTRLRVFVIPLKQQREIEHRVCIVGRGSERTAQTIDSSF